MSIWNKDEKERKVLSLEKDIEVNTLIIGAGMTGLTTAYYLKDIPSLCVVDAGLYGHGVTLNTTAKITYLQESIYTTIKKMTDEVSAKKYLDSQRDAIQYIKDIIQKENIACNLVKTPSYLFATTTKQVKTLEKEVSFLKKNGITIQKGDLPSKITSYGSYYVEDTYTFNPLKYLSKLYQILQRKNIPIYENTTIKKIEKKGRYYLCYTDNHCIKAKYVIVACHYPFFLKPFFLPLKSSIEKSYIMVSKVDKNLGYSCINVSNPTYSCRFYQEGKNVYQISLAESHNTAIKQNDTYHFKRVKEIFGLKEEDILMRYSNVDIMTSDSMPYIGKIEGNMLLATGYNTWGMTNSVLAAKILSDTLLKKRNKYKKIFNPKRVGMANIIKFPAYLVGQTKSFLGPKIDQEKPWYSNNISFQNIDGASIATYEDEHGKRHTIYNKCPHLGCSLIFNEEEKTWDCPCHSSRFDIDGNCIKGPSTESIGYKNE